MQPYLRPKKRSALKHVQDSLEDRTGKLSVKVFQNSTIIPRGQIVNIQKLKSEYTVIDDIDYCSDLIPCENQIIDETVLYAGYFRHQWGHFLLNSTARLWWLFSKEANIDLIDKIIFIATPGESGLIDANYKVFFELLDIYDKIEIIYKPKSFKKIIVPDISFEHDRFYAKEMNCVFTKIKKNIPIDNESHYDLEYKKIFLTRSHLPDAKRKEINLSFFDKLWEDNGFKVIAPEKIPLMELVKMLNQAEIIATVSGSTAHNAVFASSAASIIIMERVATVNDFQIGISKMLEQSVTYIDCFLYPLVPIPTGNVFYYYPTELLKKYIEDNNLKYFEVKELEKIKSAKNIFKFYNSYKKQSGHFWGISNNEWDLGSIEEAYSETAVIYGEVMKSSNYLKFLIKGMLSHLKRKVKK